MKKAFISSILMMASLSSIAQVSVVSPSLFPEKKPLITREHFKVHVRKENRNLYRVIHGIKGIGDSPVFIKTAACNIRHGYGALKVDVDHANQTTGYGNLRINGKHCRVLDVRGLEIKPIESKSTETSIKRKM